MLRIGEDSSLKRLLDHLPSLDISESLLGISICRTVPGIFEQSSQSLVISLMCRSVVSLHLAFLDARDTARLVPILHEALDDLGVELIVGRLVLIVVHCPLLLQFSLPFSLMA